MLSPDGCDAYLVTDRMDTDLSRLLASKEPLSEDHCKYFMYQMLCGLAYVHSANVIHRDLKPANVLINSNCELKISDFGLARPLEGESDGPAPMLTQYVVTRWYRAPEILLLARSYTKAVDLWSAGCIFAEFYRRRPLFPGNNPLHQLALITSLLGTPLPDELGGVDDKLLHALTSLPRKPPGSLHAQMPSAPEVAVDLLAALVRFDARRRLTAEEALRHPYFAALHGDGEVELAVPLNHQQFEHPDLDWPQIRQILAEERALFQRDVDIVGGESGGTQALAQGIQVPQQQQEQQQDQEHQQHQQQLIQPQEQQQRQQQQQLLLQLQQQHQRPRQQQHYHHRDQRSHQSQHSEQQQLHGSQASSLSLQRTTHANGSAACAHHDLVTPTTQLSQNLRSAAIHSPSEGAAYSTTAVSDSGGAGSGAGVYVGGGDGSGGSGASGGGEGEGIGFGIAGVSSVTASTAAAAIAAPLAATTSAVRAAQSCEHSVGGSVRACDSEPAEAGSGQTNVKRQRTTDLAQS